MEETLKLDKWGRPIMRIQVFNKSNGKSVIFPALIDTGSSHTLIEEKAIFDLGLVSISDRENVVYVGDGCYGEYLIDIVLFEKSIIENYKVGCFNAKNDVIGLIIGTDILSSFDFIYSGSANEFTLKQK